MNIQHHKVKRDVTMKLVSNAIYHFEENNKFSFHNDAYFLTIHVSNLSDIPKIIELIYLKIVKALFDTGVISNKWNGSNRPGMVSCGDTENSRRDRLTDRPVYPHIHSVLFMPAIGRHSFSHADICKIVECSPKAIREVDSVFVKKCTDINCVADIVKTTEYAAKAFFKDDGEMTEFGSFEPRVFPYQLDIQRRSGRRLPAIQKKATETEKFLMSRMIDQWAWKSNRNNHGSKRLSLSTERLQAKIMGDHARLELLEFTLDFLPDGQDVDAFFAEVLEIDDFEIGAWLGILDEGLDLVLDNFRQGR